MRAAGSCAWRRTSYDVMGVRASLTTTTGTWASVAISCHVYTVGFASSSTPRRVTWRACVVRFSDVPKDKPVQRVVNVKHLRGASAASRSHQPDERLPKRIAQSPFQTWELSPEKVNRVVPTIEADGGLCRRLNPPVKRLRLLVDVERLIGAVLPLFQGPTDVHHPTDIRAGELPSLVASITNHVGEQLREWEGSLDRPGRAANPAT